MKRQYNHTDEFYQKQYEKYLSEIKTGSAFKNFNSFKAAYKTYEASGIKDIRKNFVYQTDYEIDYNTYKAERDIMKKIGYKVKKKDLLRMSTQQFADKYKNEIFNAYNSYKKKGMSGKEAEQMISQNFFGSD